MSVIVSPKQSTNHLIVKGTHVGGNIIEDGLVFYGNSASEKSYSSGTTWRDISRRRFQNITWVNTPDFLPDFQGSFFFTAASFHYGTTGVPAIQTSPNLWTFEGWVKPDTTGAIISPSANGSDQKIICGPTSINVEICSNQDTNVRNRSTSVGIVSGQWYYFSVSIDNLDLLIYINGNLSATFIETLSIAGWNNGPLGWNIGRRTTGANYYGGYLSDLKFYNRILTADERKYNYNALKGRFGLK
jgi:hypothetical protein